MRFELEICIDDPASARAAARGGADRIEVCSALGVGGLSPSADLVELLREELDLPLHAMVRPRAGGFCYDADERRLMLKEVERFARAGCAGVVFGALDSEGEIDAEFVGALVDAAGELFTTFHRAIDTLAQPSLHLEQLAELGVRRVLSSGGGHTALEGAEELARMRERAPEGLEIMAGAGVRSDSLRELLQRSGLTRVHGSASRWFESGERVYPGRVRFAPESENGPAIRRTSDIEVAAMREILDEFESR